MPDIVLPDVFPDTVLVLLDRRGIDDRLARVRDLCERLPVGLDAARTEALLAVGERVALADELLAAAARIVGIDPATDPAEVAGLEETRSGFARAKSADRDRMDELRAVRAARKSVRRLCDI